MSSLPNPRDRYPALDGLRGFAAVAVICHHLGPIAVVSPLMAPLVWMSLLGWTGVDLFFVLSGFLITGILIKQKNTVNYYSVFYTHRALRIFPVYFALLLIFTVIVPTFFPIDSELSPGHIWPYWFFLTNIGLTNLSLINKYLAMAISQTIAPPWSLAIEEQFYLSWSVAVRWLNPRHLAYLAVAVLIGGMVLRFVLVCDALHLTSSRILLDEPDLETYQRTIFYFTLTHLDGLCIGILTRLLYDRLRFRPLLVTFARAWWMCAAAFAVLIVVDQQIGWPDTYNWYQPLMLIFGFTIAGFLFAAIILHGLLFDGWVRRVFDTAVLKRLGAYSFCMYLFHLPIYTVVCWAIAHTIRGGLGGLSTLGVEFVAVIGFAHLSYVWFESPLLSLKRFAQYRRPSPSVQPFSETIPERPAG